MTKRGLRKSLIATQTALATLDATLDFRLSKLERRLNDLVAAPLPAMAYKVAQKVMAGAENSGDAFITPDEGALRLGMSPCTVRRWLRDGILVGHRVGRRWELSERAVSEVVRARAGWSNR